MSLFSGRKSKIFLTVFLLSGVFLFILNLKTVQAYHATSSYNKLYNDTLTSENWNDLFSDFVNNWLPVSLNGPVGIATAAPASGLEVNGIIRGGSLFSSGSVGIGTTSPSVLLQVAPTSGTYSILAAAAGGAYRIGNVDDPSIDSDATNKYYVDSAISSATTSMITMPIGTNGQTLRNSSGTWTADSFLYNNGTNIGIGTTVPGTAELSVVGDLLVALPTAGAATFTEDPTGATSTGKIQLGRSGGSWESISFDPSLGSYGKFVFTAPLQIAASSPGITFYDPADPTNLTKQRSIEYSATDLQLKIGDSFKTNFGTNTGMPPSSKVFFQIGPNDLSGPSGQGVFIGANPPGDFTGDLLHFQVGGATRFRVTKFGDIISGGATMVVNGPIINTTQTWNNSGVAFTAWLMNVTDLASAAGSRLLDIQIDDSSKFIIRKDGSVGIGTTTPSALLQVAPTGVTYSILAAAANNAYRIGNVDDPSANEDAANKYYVDSTISSATSSMITMPIGTNGQTLRNNSGTWVADSNLFNDGTNIGIGTTSPGTAKLAVIGGNVGIGTTTPANILDVKGAVFTGAYASSAGVRFHDNVYGINLGGIDANSVGVIQGSAYGVGAANIALQPNGGNVGIGTTTPSAKLHIVSTNDAVYLRIQGASDGDNYGALELWNSAGTNKWQFAHKSAVGETNNFNFAHFNGTSWSAPFVISDSGNVGIGITNPSGALLQVAPTSGTYSILAGSTAPNAYRIGNVDDPSANEDAANKYYVDSAISTATGSITLWGGTTGGNIWNLNSGNVGIGTTTPGTAKLAVMGGNVGIGTTTPGTLLDVDGVAFFNNYVRITRSVDNNYGTLYLKNLSTGASASTVISFTSASTGGNALETAKIIATRGNDALDYARMDLQVKSAGGSPIIMSLLGDSSGTGGKVGIGVTNPATLLDVNGSFSVSSSTAANAIGGTTVGAIQLIQKGTFINTLPTTAGRALLIDTTVNTTTAGLDSYVAQIRGGVSTATSGTIATIAGLYITQPTITNNGATVTNASSLYILAAPTGGTNNYALYSAAGTNYFGGAVGIGITNPSGALLHVAPTSGTYSILAGSTAPNAYRIGNVDDPSTDYDAANKYYVDSTISSATSSSALWGGTTGGNIWSLNSGNVGIGTTGPLTQLQVGTTGSLFDPNSGGNIMLGRNIYYSSGWKYITTSAGSGLAQNSDGSMVFYSLPSGNAGATATVDPTTERMRIQGSTGNVGIGTTAPTDLFYTAGNTDKVLSILSTAGVSSAAVLNLGNTSVTSGANAGAVNFGSTGDSASDKRTALILSTMTASNATTPSGNLRFFTANAGTVTEKMTILPDGDVGIGTTAPGEKLDLNGNIVISSDMATGGLTGGNYINWKRASDNWNPAKIAAGFTNTGDYGGYIRFDTNNGASVSDITTKMIINKGNVGIGITNPSVKLHAAPTSGTYSILAGGTAPTAYRIGNVDDPSANEDAANKYYVDSAISTATSSISTVPVGTNGQTLRNNSGTWVATSNLFNDGTKVGIGTTVPAQKIDIAGALKLANAVVTASDSTSGNSYQCDSTKTGTFRYDSASGQSYLCDGTRWLNQKNCGVMTDDARQTYSTVQIGGQCWMAENINIGTMLASGGTEPNTSDQIIEKWCYNNDPAQCAAQGGFYNWGEAMRGSQTAGARGICPAGWHIPTDAEYNKLEKTVLGLVASPNAQYVCDFSVAGWRRCADNSGDDSGGSYGAGKSLKGVGVGSGNGIGNDLAGFNGKLSGYRNTGGSFYGLGSNLVLWSSTPDGSSYAWLRDLYSTYSTVYRDSSARAYGFSVRCLRD